MWSSLIFLRDLPKDQGCGEKTLVLISMGHKVLCQRHILWIGTFPCGGHVARYDSEGGLHAPPIMTSQAKSLKNILEGYIFFCGVLP